MSLFIGWKMMGKGRVQIERFVSKRLRKIPALYKYFELGIGRIFQEIFSRHFSFTKILHSIPFKIPRKTLFYTYWSDFLGNRFPLMQTASINSIPSKNNDFAERFLTWKRFCINLNCLKWNFRNVCCLVQWILKSDLQWKCSDIEI